jgi:hypothetical protein
MSAILGTQQLSTGWNVEETPDFGVTPFNYGSLLAISVEFDRVTPRWPSGHRSHGWGFSMADKNS